MLNAKTTKVKLFDGLSGKRLQWKKKNRYYYEDQLRYFRFLVPENMDVLELGCGTGDLLNDLKPKYGLGVDFSKGMVDVARSQYPHLDFICEDIEQFTGHGQVYDFIILSDVIGHLFDIQKILKQLHIFCKPETRLIVSYHNFLWEPILKLGEKLGLKMPQNIQNWLSAEDIVNLLNISLFQVIKTEFRLLIPKKIPLISNLINQYFGTLPGIRRLCLTQYIVARPIKESRHKKASTTILIPCMNEKGNIEAAVQRIPKFGGSQEIIFVEGGSTDGTRDEIERVLKKYPEKSLKLLIQEGKGKGDAVRKGFGNATGDILMILDGDLTVPPEDLPKFYAVLIENHGEFVNGCRLVYPMEKEAMRFLNLLGNKFFSLMFTWILNQRLKDTLCGTKVLYKKDYEKIMLNRSYFGEFDPFGDFDLIFGAVKQNLKIVEIPIRYKERTYGSTNISRFRHGWLLLKMTLFAYKKIKAI